MGCFFQLRIVVSWRGPSDMGCFFQLSVAVSWRGPSDMGCFFQLRIVVSWRGPSDMGCFFSNSVWLYFGGSLLTLVDFPTLDVFVLFTFRQSTRLKDHIFKRRSTFWLE